MIISPDAQDRDAGWVQGTLLSMVAAFVIMNAMVVVPIIPKLHVAFAGTANSEILVSMVAVMPTLGIAFSSLVAAAIGDRLDRRRLLAGGTALFAIASVLPFWLDSLPLILVARAVTGIALGAMVTGSMALTADYFSGAPRQRWLGIQHAVSSAVAMLISAVVGVLGENDWRVPFLLMFAAVPYFLALILFRGPHLAPPSAMPVSGGQVAGPDAAPWSMLAGISALTILSCIILFAPLFELGLVYQERKLGGSALTGVSVSLMAVGSVAGSLAFILFKRYSPPAKLAALYLVSAVGTFLIGSAAQTIPIIIGAILVGLGQGLMLPVLQGWLLDGTPDRIRARFVGIFNLVFFLSTFCMPLVARAVAIRSGGASAGMVHYALAGGAVLLGLGLHLLHRRTLLLAPAR